MATKQQYNWSEIRKEGPYFSTIRTTIETPFYKNNVYPVQSLKEAYKLAYDSPGAVVTGLDVYQPEKIGLPHGAKVIGFNDGAVKGRCAAARRIVGEPDIDVNEYAMKIRDAVYDTNDKLMYHAQAYVGLDEDFMVKAHLLIPEGQENIMYSWLLNFQYLNEAFHVKYSNSKHIENEGDIYIFSDPTWSHPDHPLGLTFFDPEYNCAAILGMRYFGEHKKGTLTLAWGIANRHGYAACHGGQKRYNLTDDKTFVAGVFGLSGSGKSTITHAKHCGRYDVTVLHDDAFIISTQDGSSVALEPSYFDKLQDYPMEDEDNKFLLTVQNVGFTMDNNGKIVLVTEDIRNGNGRAVKSKLWSPNREDKFDEKADAIFWLMKDPTLPPLLKVTDPILASAMGATLATKRTSAERLANGVNPNALVVEPYANPFRTYRLANDYEVFKKLFKESGVQCYILNTGEFMGKDITKRITLSLVEAIVEGTADFEAIGLPGLLNLPIDGYEPDFSNIDYKKKFIARMYDRVTYIEQRETVRGGYDKLPKEALTAVKNVVLEAEKL